MCNVAIPKVSILASCYHGDRYLASYLDYVAKQTYFDNLEIVLIHNEPSEKELGIVETFRKQYPDHIKHLIVDPVESLPASWNRGWLAARGEYLCIWNIDDIRTPDSIERQAAMLDACPDVAMVYGDYMVVARNGETQGQLADRPEFTRALFTRYNYAGPFPMWRKSLATELGYFDEQFKFAPDCEYNIRVAFRHPMRRVPGLMGFFTDEGMGLSSKQETAIVIQVEVVAIKLRYGVYEAATRTFIPQAMKYKISDTLEFNVWHAIQPRIPGYSLIKFSRRFTAPFIILHKHLRRIAKQIVRPSHA